MLYTCNTCHYTYPIDFLYPMICPDCGSHAIRLATDDEEEWYNNIQQEKESNPLMKDKSSKRAS